MIRSFSGVLVLWFRVFWVLFFDFIISYYYLFQVLEIEKSSTSSLMLQEISSVHSRPAIQPLPSNSCVVKYSMCTRSIMLNDLSIRLLLTGLSLRRLITLRFPSLHVFSETFQYQILYFVGSTFFFSLILSPLYQTYMFKRIKSPQVSTSSNDLIKIVSLIFSRILD